MRYFIEDTTLTAIGDAVRAKSGSNDLIKVSELADAITNLSSGGGGNIEVEPIVLSGDCSYACQGMLAGNYINLFGNTISTSDITVGEYMFQNFTNDVIPFDINFKAGTTTSVRFMFNNSKITKAPRIYNVKPGGQGVISLFNSCKYLKEVAEDFCDTWDFSYINTYTSGSQGSVFSNCYSLRKFPIKLVNNGYNAKLNSSSNSPYYNVFQRCYVLDEINDLGVIPQTWDINKFLYSFENCSRLKSLTFETNEDGTPKTANWKNQEIRLTAYVGHIDSWGKGGITDYNSGITADKEVKDDVTYQALKDDPDWWSASKNYSRYNKTSAVETINSLPDCSAYGSNTITFNGEAGALTDGGAINTLTEEEIAVAASKGWTVSFA